MEENKIKNFSLGKEEIRFKQDDLIFITSFNKTKSMLGLSYGEKINQIQQRQRRFVDNVRKVITLNQKKQFVGKKRKLELDEAIEKFISENKTLMIEIAKFRVSLSLENQPEVADLDIYKKLITSRGEETVEDLMKINILDMIHQEMLNHVLMENSELFSNFTGQAYMRSTTSSFVAFINPILKDHGYKLSKIRDFEEVNA